jgi:chemotaxis protein methyltransferase CheR
LPKVDIIFIRNVLIYFNGETKKLILDKMMALMKPDSLIIFGQAESPMNFTDRFERYKKVQSSVYQLKAR